MTSGAGKNFLPVYAFFKKIPHFFIVPEQAEMSGYEISTRTDDIIIADQVIRKKMPDVAENHIKVSVSPVMVVPDKIIKYQSVSRFYIDKFVGVKDVYRAVQEGGGPVRELFKTAWMDGYVYRQTCRCRIISEEKPVTGRVHATALQEIAEPVRPGAIPGNEECFFYCIIHRIFLWV